MNQDFIVSTLEDENDGDFSAGDLSLREAIAQANDREGEDTITLDTSLNDETIVLSQGELKIEDSLTVNGLGAENTIIDANGINRVFNIDDGNEDTQVDVALNGLAITGSSRGEFDPIDTSTLLDSGGGILNSENLEVNNSAIYDNEVFYSGAGISSSGTLSVNNSAIYSNSVSSDGNELAGGVAGGGINSSGTLSVNNSAIYSNSVSGGFGGANGGGIANSGTATINQSTISDNNIGARANNGGGIENSEGDLTITNSTISNNSSNSAGGISNNGGEVTVTSTIIANVGNQNISGDDFVSGGNNFISGEAEVGSRAGLVIISAEGFIDGENGDIVGTLENPLDPQLGELQDNGGSTPTQALLDGSPAIDAGANPNELATDQRGEGFDRTVGDETDIGAFEVQSDGEEEISADLVVSILEDENDGDFSTGDLSLREAIANSNDGDTIAFDSSLNDGTIGLTLGELVIDKDLTITGLGANNLTIDGNSPQGESGAQTFNRVFNVDDGDDNTTKNVTLEGITITGGQTIDDNSGGGILNQENLTLNSSVVSDNETENGTGGGILNRGEFTLNSSVVSDNSAGFRSSGGGISNPGTAKIINSTITRNSAFLPGAGISSSGSLDIANSTITNNGGGSDFGGDGVNSIDGSTTVTGSIVAGNGSSDDDSDLQGDFTSGGNNLIGNVDDATGFTDDVNNDLVGTPDLPLEPRLDELQDNGGSTPTIALLDSSPAIDAGSNPNDLATDQRGEGFNRTVGDGTDIGAFELQDGEEIPADLVVSTLEDEDDGDFSEGNLSLREAIATSEIRDTIAFDSSLSGGTITLTLGELTIDKSLVIDGLGADNLTIDGNNESRVFNVDDDNVISIADVFVDGLTITNGDTGDGSGTEINGGGFLNQENLTITNSALVGNKAGNGGGIYSSGQLQLDNSLITDSDGTGPIFNDGGAARVSNSTITGNDVGGIGAIVNSEAGELELSNSTITNNNSLDAALFNSEEGTATVTSTIIAGNTGGIEPGRDDVIGTFASGGNNLIGNSNGSSGFDDPSDLAGTADNPLDPLLGELQDNGGLIKTIALLDESPAIDAGSNPNNLATDQRGAGFDRTVGEATDIGAFEVQDAIAGGEIEGTDGDDELSGTEANDIILGLAGNDSIDGGIGDDLITGGDNDDTFVLTTEGGIDTITDFGNGNDVLGLSEETSFSDLSFSGNEIILGDSTLATLNSFDTTTLTESDFMTGDFVSI